MGLTQFAGNQTAETVFYFGAGASANCLPTYANFRNRFTDFADFLDKINKVFSSNNETLYLELKQLAQDLQYELLTHNTPDTVAKKYFHLNDIVKLNNLKIILTFFLAYEQTTFKDFASSIPHFGANWKDPFDKRYDALIATILEQKRGEVKLPGNAKLITWNYDLQFEIAFSRYLKQNLSSTIQNIQSFNSDDFAKKSFDTNLFAVFHLNGYSFIERRSDQQSLFANFDLMADPQLYIDSVVENFQDIQNPHSESYQNQDQIKFSWEWYTPKAVNNFLSTIQRIVNRARSIVITGYSFPPFNRKVDYEIFKNAAAFNRIYIQSTDAERIKYVLLNEILSYHQGLEQKIELINYTEPFFIPSDLF